MINAVVEKLVSIAENKIRQRKVVVMKELMIQKRVRGR